jgi:antitoxin component of MazEF toxin-antitoxin module
MIKRLTTSGNSIALVLDRELLDEAQIDPDKPVEVSASGGVIVISPVRDAARQKRFKEVAGSVARRHAAAFKRLAE